MNRLSLILAMIVLVGCAQMPTYKETIVHEGPVPEMAPDQKTAVVTFYRPSSFLGSAIPFFVQENGKNIGTLGSGTYFSFRTSPGRHTYTAIASSADVDEITVRVRANSTNYIEATVYVGELADRPHLKEVPADTANSSIPKLKYIELKRADGRSLNALN